MKKSIRIFLALTSLALVTSSHSLKESNSDNAGDDYQKEITEGQSKRLSELKGANSPLNLVGMLWLKEGENTFGSSRDNALIFPENKLIDKAGKYSVEGDQVFVDVQESAGITV